MLKQIQRRSSFSRLGKADQVGLVVALVSLIHDDRRHAREEHARERLSLSGRLLLLLFPQCLNPKAEDPKQKGHREHGLVLSELLEIRILKNIPQQPTVSGIECFLKPNDREEGTRRRRSNQPTIERTSSPTHTAVLGSTQLASQLAVQLAN